MIITVFAVVDEKGEVRRNKRAQGSGLRIYTNQSTAQRCADRDGDSVVEATIDLSRAPLFIRNRKVDPDGAA